MRQKRIFARLGWILMLAILCVNLSGCIQNPFQITNSYESYYSSQEEKETEGLEGMAADLAVLDADHENTAGYQSNDYADLLINDSRYLADNQEIWCATCLEIADYHRRMLEDEAHA